MKAQTLHFLCFDVRAVRELPGFFDRISFLDCCPLKIFFFSIVKLFLVTYSETSLKG